MRAAVFYATREGHTRQIAEHIARDLCAHGIEVGLFDVRTDHRAIHWDHYDRVFVAASVHAERHEPEMVDFVKAHRQDLERLSAAFLSVNLFEAVAEDLNASPEHRAQAAADARQMCDLFGRETGWHPSHIMLVAGALTYRRYNLIVRFVMRRIARKAGLPATAKRDYDFTNWAAVDQFVRTVTDGIPVPSAVS
jgi:menaquinone-dependent protoporphyrinogen oxidase